GQRAASAPPAAQGVAEALPFPEGAFDAATAFITIHHWPDWKAGLREMRRVARRVLVLGVDTRVLDGYWLRGYFGYFGSANDPVTLDDVVTELGAPEVIPIPTPHDCIDGFAAAYWRRPEMYLDPSVRGCISGF